MVKHFQEFISKNQLFAPTEKILISVSSGVDSSVLVHLFQQCKLNFGLIHCNFQLRGKESELDQKFVKKMSKTIGVSIFTKNFDTKRVAKEEGISTQMAARYLRYDWFEQIRGSNDYDWVATAHHQDDLVETLILNFIKGAGIQGFEGIKLKWGKVIRPLLFAGKGAILEYARKNQIKWREDKSNQSNIYQRNKLRNEIIPKLKELNPNLEKTLMRTAEQMRAVEKVYFQNIFQQRTAITADRNGDIVLKLSGISNQPNPKLLLWELLKPYGFNFDQCGNIAKAAGKKSGKLFYTPSHQLNVDREELIVSPLPSPVAPPIEIKLQDKEIINDDLKLCFSVVDASQFKISNDPKVANLDFEKLSFPLKLRIWQKGDWFVPLGMKGKKKVSDFMIDNKIPLYKKQRTSVILSGDEIIWLVGHRVDERSRITKSTKSIYVISKVD
ncbi:MAG: tRNA lysidine(34) synthetase TilS [Bacteroidetes bacterium]|nr:tRNA lysidine(34) synthetase TilS [Bacteroidota bacterium]